jgi:hypothetical protein
MPWGVQTSHARASLPFPSPTRARISPRPSTSSSACRSRSNATPFAALDVLRGAHATLSEEVRRYTPSRLRHVVEKAGFTIERLTFVNASLFPLMLPVRVIQRWTSKSGDIPAGEFDIHVPAAPVNSLLSGLVWMEAATLRHVNMPIGSSILCRARKPA